MGDARAHNSDDVAGVGVPEVGNIELVKFLSSDDSAIAQAVRRVQHEAERQMENYAAFGNTP